MPPYRVPLSAGVPEGWVAKGSITLVAPDGEANVIASTEPLEEVVDTERFADARGEVLEQGFPGYREMHAGPVRLLGGRRVFHRIFEWTPEDSEPVTQIQVYHVEGRQAFTATATTPSATFEASQDVLKAILAALRIE
jgi:hypothetical protein